jgi:hypothetical protein
MELSDLMKMEEIPKGTVLTVEQLNAYGLHKERKLGEQVVYWGQGKGICILDEVEGNQLRVYIHTRAQRSS